MATLHPQTTGPLKAWRFNPNDQDQRELHQFSPNQAVSIADLAALGVLYWNIIVSDDDKHMEKVETICAERQYKNRDVINIHKDTLPNYDQKLKIFFEEHIHEDEEIRFILDGSGYFDVRDKNDEWIRIAANKSDMIILPAGMYHRFTLDTNNYIKAMRLFKEDPQWTPLNREVETTDSNKYRLDYLREFHGVEIATLLPQLTGPLQAWKFNPTAEDQRELHQYSPNQPVSIAELSKLGVLYWNIAVTDNEAAHMQKVETICSERKYKNRDVINIHKDTLPNYDQKLKIFFEEHIHEDEEIRFILDGSGYFDVRDKNDEWIRIAANKSDMIILPAGMYHRFTLDTNNYIKAMRLFKEDPQWTPLNREVETTDSNKYRLDYLREFHGVEILNVKKRGSDSELEGNEVTKKVAKAVETA
ncbi:1,2-dihydroxy-3-keto-5-methylthiopentene dioxygenase 3 [Obelidium mucronatum]|nr:1,2-dihydroxy-3-keto-5-methylthiopentene dioxygenase 3 [Obelidium mucronatum]